MRCKPFFNKFLRTILFSNLLFLLSIISHNNLFASHTEEKDGCKRKKIVVISTDSLSFDDYLSEISKSQLVVILPSGKVREDAESRCGMLIPVKIYYDSAQIESIVRKIEKKYGIEWIIGYGEFDILRAARLRDFLNIPGQNYESV